MPPSSTVSKKFKHAAHVAAAVDHAAHELSMMKQSRRAHFGDGGEQQQHDDDDDDDAGALHVVAIDAAPPHHDAVAAEPPVDPRLSGVEVAQLSVCYHRCHANVRSFWGLHMMLEEECRISISPPFLAVMLRRVGVAVTPQIEAMVLAAAPETSIEARPPAKGDEDPREAQERDEHFFISETRFINLIALIRFDEQATAAYHDSDAHLLDLAYAHLEPDERGNVSSAKLDALLNDFSLKQQSISGGGADALLSLKKLTASLYGANGDGSAGGGGGRRGGGHNSSAGAGAGRVGRLQTSSLLARRESLPSFDESMIGNASPLLGDDGADDSNPDSPSNAFSAFTSFRYAALLMPAIANSSGGASDRRSITSDSANSPAKRLRRLTTKSVRVDEDSIGKIVMMSRNAVTANFADRMDFSRGESASALLSATGGSSTANNSLSGTAASSPFKSFMRRSGDANPVASVAETPLDIGGLAASHLGTPADTPLAGAGNATSVASVPLAAGRRRVSILNLHQDSGGAHDQRPPSSPSGQHNLPRSRGNSLQSIGRRSSSRESVGSSPLDVAVRKGILPDVFATSSSQQQRQQQQQGGVGATDELQASTYISSSEDDDAPDPTIPLVVGSLDRLPEAGAASLLHARRAASRALASRPWKERRAAVSSEVKERLRKRKALKKAGLLPDATFCSEFRALHLKQFPTYGLLDATAKRLHHPVHDGSNSGGGGGEAQTDVRTGRWAEESVAEAKAAIEASDKLARWTRSGNVLPPITPKK